MTIASFYLSDEDAARLKKRVPLITVQIATHDVVVPTFMQEVRWGLSLSLLCVHAVPLCSKSNTKQNNNNNNNKPPKVLAGLIGANKLYVEGGHMLDTVEKERFWRDTMEHFVEAGEWAVCGAGGEW